MKQQNLRIGFDFDKVFVNYPQFVPDTLINRLYKKKNGKLAYRMPGKFEQKIRILSHHHLFRTPISTNVDVLKKISNSGNQVFLISSRFGFLRDRTEYWLDKYELRRYFKGIYFNYENKQPHKFKDAVIKKLKITHYIDDDFDLIMYLAEHNPKVTFYWLTKNSHINTSLPKNVKSISVLTEFPKNIYT